MKEISQNQYARRYLRPHRMILAAMWAAGVLLLLTAWTHPEPAPSRSAHPRAVTAPASPTVHLSKRVPGLPVHLSKSVPGLPVKVTAAATASANYPPDIIRRWIYGRQFVNASENSTARSGSVCNLGNEAISLGNNQIWFVETSYREALTAREACSIESACKHNPNHTVHLLTTGNIQDAGCPYHNVLSQLGNFKSASINVSAVLEETPVGKLYNKGVLKRDAHAVSHLSDFLRYAVLWYRGGIYLDTDVIVIKSLGGIRNNAVYESDNKTVGSTVLAFDAGHFITWNAMDKCARGYRPGVWINCGPGAMTSLFADATIRSSIAVLKSATFFPVAYTSYQNLFMPEKTKWALQTVNGSYGIHFWNHLSNTRQVVRGCAIEVLAREHCPRVHKLASSLQNF